MKPISKLRISIIVLVTVVALILTFPTIRYYLHLRHQSEYTALLTPRPEGPEPPAAVDEAARQQWEAQNPELAAWYQEHAPYHQWAEREQQLRQRAIPLGLDLQGGVDVTLTVDEAKAIAGEVDELRASIQRAFENEQINVETRLLAGQPAFELQLLDTTNTRRASILISEWQQRITGPMNEEALAAGPVVYRMEESEVAHRISETMDGVRKAISERVNALGVTQPRISLVGNDQIRIQVPGYKDPQHLINTVIRPAHLEFRLVHARNHELIDPATGRLRVGAELPVGTELVPGREGQLNRDTNQMEFKEVEYVLLDRPELTGANLRSAGVDIDPMRLDNPIVVSLAFDAEGTRRFADVTTRHQGRQMAILLDGVVRSAPVLEDPILNGRAIIRGGFTQQEATELSQVLKAGALPAELQIESQRVVGATLGGDSIVSGVQALLVGSLAVTIFMVVYYGTAGVISVLALILNVMIILAIMSLANATLTLSGIGGILLTVGMAVDANVLIYERIREELAAGRPLRQAIGTGFNRAFTVILDSNLTTLLTALVLLQFTEGSVFGFALTMTFGLLANLFTGLTVTYTLCALWFSRRGTLNLGKLAMFSKANYDFINLRKLSIPFSIILIVGSLVLLAARGGLVYGVDFSGGYRAEVEFTENVGIDQIRDALNMPDERVQEVVGEVNMFLIDVGLVEAAEGQEVSQLQATRERLQEQLNSQFGAEGYVVLADSGFGEETSRGFLNLAITLVFLASLAILAYLWFRFELAFGVAAIIALVHDMLLVVLLATLWNVQISLDTVAALMVLLGFSVNDTIVVFDRIRESTRTMFNKSFGEICNISMNQTLSRTIITSGTLLFTSLALLFIGGAGLASFAKVITLGAIIGTYSSNFLATPLVYEWNRYKGNRLQQALAAKKKKVEAAKPIGGRPAGGAPRPGSAGR